MSPTSPLHDPSIAILRHEWLAKLEFLALDRLGMGLHGIIPANRIRSCRIVLDLCQRANTGRLPTPVYMSAALIVERDARLRKLELAAIRSLFTIFSDLPFPKNIIEYRELAKEEDHPDLTRNGSDRMYTANQVLQAAKIALYYASRARKSALEHPESLENPHIQERDRLLAYLELLALEQIPPLLVDPDSSRVAVSAANMILHAVKFETTSLADEVYAALTASIPPVEPDFLAEQSKAGIGMPATLSGGRSLIEDMLNIPSRVLSFPDVVELVLQHSAEYRRQAQALADANRQPQSFLAASPEIPTQPETIYQMAEHQEDTDEDTEVVHETTQNLSHFTNPIDPDEINSTDYFDRPTQRTPQLKPRRLLITDTDRAPP